MLKLSVQILIFRNDFKVYYENLFALFLYVIGVSNSRFVKKSGKNSTESVQSIIDLQINMVAWHAGFDLNYPLGTLVFMQSAIGSSV